MKALILTLAAATLSAHAPITPAPRGALTASGPRLVDSEGQVVFLRGVEIPGLQFNEERNAAAMTDGAFVILRRRWNLNTVRLPVSVWRWRREGQSYLDRAAAIVRLANESDLVVVLAAWENTAAGAPADFGLPTQDTLAFWRAWAAAFRDNPRVIFSAFEEPSIRNVPGAVASGRTAADWRFWLRGGIAADGTRAAGMQEIVDTIRGAGARQMIAVPAFHDALGFQGLDEESFVRDANILYEFHPFFEFGLADAERQASFGFLSGRFPVYAGAWGLRLREGGPGCAALPADASLTDILFQTFNYFDLRSLHWTAAGFEPGGLVRDAGEFSPTVLDRPWTCGQTIPSQPGMGQLTLLWMTGDPDGFGIIRPGFIASAAGGPAAPLVPGALISIYAEQLGPDTPAFAAAGESGRLPQELSGTRVLIDGVAAPLIMAGAFQINAQVPYEVVGKTSATMQVTAGKLSSNTIVMEVVAAAPELFTEIGTRTAIALNEDGVRNGFANPAARGSIVVLFGTAGGQTSPGGVTGAPAPMPHPTLVNPPAITVDGRDAEVLFAGEVPGFAGLLQINVRLPLLPGPLSVRTVPVVVRSEGRGGRAPASLWVR
jgi:uncharacterized protein (TIGR03437 family)